MAIAVICCISTAFAGRPDEDRDIREFLQKLYASRAELLLQGDDKLVSDFYSDQEALSRHAKRMELKRSSYLRAWAERRNVKLVSAEPAIRIVRLKKDSGAVRASLVQSMKLTYRYDNPLLPPHHFGIGTRHSLTLRQIDGKWYVAKEWYLDPFDENPDLIPARVQRRGIKPPADQASAAAQTGKRGDIRFNREQALAYANKYAGSAWGAGNDNRYNRNYRDYTGLGGDCTNFVSQVLGDPKEGGGLPMRHGWRYSKTAGGSVSWVRTDNFKQFILYSGYGKLVAKGTFSELMKPTKQYEKGAFQGLLPGDVIGYELEGDIDHFAVFVGFDDNGYPLVNCHTTDRFRTPFDLGWDRTTRYWLIHIVE
ncbi:amidase domain-containing protein [Paenibacillus sp. GYB003]|uniref:amidase domain-containing protein n=1 Tax=Paenibacillus sp. GYB003 TaxID=2994392 RepID=UPI002F9630C4